MKKKIFTLLTLLLAVCSGAWATDYAFTATPTLSGTAHHKAANSQDVFAIASGTGAGKICFQSVGDGTGFYYNSTQTKLVQFKGTRYMSIIELNAGDAITFTYASASAGSSDGKFTIENCGTSSTTNLSLSDGGEAIAAGTVVTSGTTYYVLADGYVDLKTNKNFYWTNLNITEAAVAASAPSTPTFTPDGGNVNGNTNVTIASTDATRIYYCWSNSSEAPEAGDAAYTALSGSSKTVTVPNETNAAKYLHAYGWNNYNSGSNSGIYSKSFNITKVADPAGLVYGTTAITKNADEAAFINALTNPNGLTVTYSITSNGTGSTINATTGEVTIGSTATGTETITASSAATSDYLAGEATYTLTVTKNLAAPTFTLESYDYEEGGYKITPACATEGVTLTYKIGSGSSTPCTVGVPFYAKNGKLVITAAKTGWTSATNESGTQYILSAAPSATSPEKLFPFNTSGDNGDKDKLHAYKSVSMAGTYFAGVDNSLNTDKQGLKLRCNRTFKVGDDDINGFCLDVKPGYKVTGVKFTYLKSNRAGTINVSNMYVDGVDQDGFSTFDIPASSGSALTKEYTGLAATSRVGWKLVPGKYDTTKDVDQFRITIEVTYERATVAITPAKTYTTLTCASALDFTDSDLKAYIVKDVDVSDNKITMTQVNKVPANTGLVIKAATPGDVVSVPVLIGDPDDVSGNHMVGSASSTTSTPENSGYILKDGAFHPVSGGDLPAGKAYLKIDVSAPMLTLSFDESETTGISTSLNDKADKINDQYIYNLNGQRVAQPTKGLYIVNGKKVIIK